MERRNQRQISLDNNFDAHDRRAELAGGGGKNGRGLDPRSSKVCGSIPNAFLKLKRHPGNDLRSCEGTSQKVETSCCSTRQVSVVTEVIMASNPNADFVR